MSPQPQQATKAAVRIIHYNDVYNIAEGSREPVGGAARFITAVREAASTPIPSLTLFSGDAFSPAPLTPLTLGAEMPPILNATNIDVACIGNHEFDLGLDVMKARLSETNFPWVLSNLKLRARGAEPARMLHGVQELLVLERAGVRFGFMGLASVQWLETLDKIPLSAFEYVDFVRAADEMAVRLREEHRCSFIVAMTHMRQPEDELLAREARDVDLILGGHDHVLSKKLVNGRYVVKSGTDFKNYSTIDLVHNSQKGLLVAEPVHHEVTRATPQDPEFAKYVDENLSVLGTGGADVVAVTAKDLDGRFISIRTRETNLGNLVCDVLTDFLGTHISLVNAGSFRADMVEPAGDLTNSAIAAILPFNDQAAVVRITGRKLLAILENSVSQYPLLDGRFCQVSGLSFAFDAAKPPGKRVRRDTVFCKVSDDTMELLEESKVYKCAIKTFIFAGKDGFAKGNPSDIVSTCGTTIRVMLTDELRRRGEAEDSPIPFISPSVEGRIVCINPDAELLKNYGDNN